MIRVKQTYKILMPAFIAGICLLFANFLYGQQGRQLTIDELMGKVAAEGKLKFKKDVPVRYMTREDLKRYVAAQFEADYPGELAEKENRFLYLMGFVDKDTNVRDVRKRILLNNVAGIYNEKNGQLLALNDYRSVDFFHGMVLVHELRHALQDQHFDLSGRTLLGGNSDFDDRKLAGLAAIEGDAMLLMVMCGGMNADILTATADADALFSFAPVTNPSLLYHTPPVIKQQLLMPYLEGLRFVNQVFKKKKWKGVNKILTRLPDSTEQILHPEKYLKREIPDTVTISYEPQGYQLYHSGIIGEYLLRILVQPSNSFTQKPYAQGWGGDTFHVYKHDSEPSYFLVWESLWDKDVFGSHFYSDFKRFLELRFQVNFKAGNVKGMPFVAGRSQQGEDYFFLMKSGNKLFFARSDHRKQMNAFIYGGNYD